MSHVTALPSGIPTTRDYLWAIASRSFSGISHLQPVRLSSRDDGESAFRRINAGIEAATPRSWTNQILAILLTKQIASTAVVKHVCRMFLCLSVSDCGMLIRRYRRQDTHTAQKRDP